jgi:hypothetical protein
VPAMMTVRLLGGVRRRSRGLTRVVVAVILIDRSMEVGRDEVDLYWYL